MSFSQTLLLSLAAFVLSNATQDQLRNRSKALVPYSKPPAEASELPLDSTPVLLQKLELEAKPMTVTNRFLQSLTVDKIKGDGYLGGGMNGDVFQVHIKKDSRPYVVGSGTYLGKTLGTWGRTRVEKEYFALKCLRSSVAGAIDTNKKEEARLHHWVTKKHEC
uniref:Protein kinase domain-containing protein n=1 Tax=Chromera velia CCMP2878 TaxID=1169474 RepID=A0A0G4FJW4_9ALVE|eukprot:Cvel_17429.t1-p1 / transcript=Cvel_17429.t1 / gene=Cvel_17429 / organism=Chromera_velia_CCMP2878 / gene_product=hypothetical protein / transcript_product=hypothetical protein / location=Cvel_scaffold1389:34672-35157(+) / protein_length=162 / sequence_SO=supercontig / SO=protein_coding / is_pseudo=false